MWFTQLYTAAVLPNLHYAIHLFVCLHITYLCVNRFPPVLSAAPAEAFDLLCIRLSRQRKACANKRRQYNLLAVMTNIRPSAPHITGNTLFAWVMLYGVSKIAYISRRKHIKISAWISDGVNMHAHNAIFWICYSSIEIEIGSSKQRDSRFSHAFFLRSNNENLFLADFVFFSAYNLSPNKHT